MLTITPPARYIAQCGFAKLTKMPLVCSVPLACPFWESGMTLGVEVKKDIPVQLDLGNLVSFDDNSLEQTAITRYVTFHLSSGG